MQFWHEQSNRYHAELKDFKKRTAVAMDGLRNEHSALFKDLQGAAVRVDRVEREMDYVETQNSPRACSNKADKVLEQGAWGLEESRGEEVEGKEWEELNSGVSGELQGITYMFLLDAFHLSFVFMTERWHRQNPCICVYVCICIHRLCIMTKFSSHSRHPSLNTYSHGKSSASGKTGNKHGAVTGRLTERWESVGTHVFQRSCGFDTSHLFQQSNSPVRATGAQHSSL